MFKNLGLKIRTRFARKKKTISRQSISFDEASKIGIIAQKEELKNSKIIDKFVHEFEALGKNVDVLLIDKRKDSFKANKSYKILKPEDITWNGAYKSDHIKKFVEKKFDYLYSLSLSSDVSVQNILANCKARFRVGNLEEEKEELFELMIDTKKSPKLTTLADQMLYYSRNIKSTISK